MTSYSPAVSLAAGAIVHVAGQLYGALAVPGQPLFDVLDRMERR